MPRRGRRDDATRTSFRPLNAPKYGLRKHEYRRTAELTLRYKGEEQDTILVPFMYSKSEQKYLIKISEKPEAMNNGDGNSALWRWIDILDWEVTPNPAIREEENH